MNFVKTLKLLRIFGLVVEKIHINCKIYSQSSNIFILYINLNKQYNDG